MKVVSYPQEGSNTHGVRQASGIGGGKHFGIRRIGLREIKCRWWDEDKCDFLKPDDNKKIAKYEIGVYNANCND